MSIFGGNTSTSFKEVTAPVYEGYNAEVNGDIIALQESLEDHIAIIEALHSLDMEELALRGDVRALKENGASEQEIDTRVAEFETVTEAMAKDAWTKVKEFFSKLWGKIKAFFGSVVRAFDAIFKSSQDFVKKYEAQLKKLDLAGFEYKMHNYTNIDNADFTKADSAAEAKDLLATATAVATSATNEKNTEELREVVSKMREDREDHINQYRGKLLGTSSLTAEQFSEELYGMFRNGAKDNGDAKEQSVRIGDIVETIKNNEGKKQADAFAKSVDTEFGKIIKTINDLQGKLSNAKAKDGNVSVKHGDSTHTVQATATNVVLDALRAYGSLFSTQKDTQLQVFRAWRTAYEERNRTYKAVCMAAFRHKAGKK